MVSLRKRNDFGGAPNRSHCNQCGGRRNHEILNTYKSQWDDELGYGQSIGGTDNYYLLRCAGCGAIHHRHDSTFSEHTEGDGSPIVSTKYYPPAYARRRPDWLSETTGPFWTGDHPVGSLLEEIYVALQNGLPKLAAMGIRALLEHVMIEQVGDHNSFRNNIRVFFDEGLLAQRDRELFEGPLIEIGHASMHRGYSPPKDDLEVIMDVVEAIYVRPGKVASIKPIPARS